MAPRKYSFGLAGQQFDFELPSIGEGGVAQTESVLASMMPELRLSYGAKTRRGGRLGRDVTPVSKEISLVPFTGGGGTTVNVGAPTATANVNQAAADLSGITGSLSQIIDILKTPTTSTAITPVSTPTPTPSPTPAVEPVPTTEPTTGTPAARQFTGDIGGIKYQDLRGAKFTAADVQAAIKGGYDPASVFGFAASLPKSELGQRVRSDIKEAGFKLSEKGAYGGTLPSTPTAAQTFLDTSVAKQLSKGAEKQVSAAVARAQGIPVAAASSTAQPTSIASPFTYVAPPAPAASARASAAPTLSFGGSASFSSSGGGGGRGGKGK